MIVAYTRQSNGGTGSSTQKPSSLHGEAGVNREGNTDRPALPSSPETFFETHAASGILLVAAGNPRGDRGQELYRSSGRPLEEGKGGGGREVRRELLAPVPAC